MCGLGLHVEKNHQQNVLYGEALCSKIGHCTPLVHGMQGLSILSSQFPKFCFTPCIPIARVPDGHMYESYEGLCVGVTICFL